ncbi:unconventional myosin-Ie [Nilaparvata lugens]|uniref:unconventional myosin-Ie n=1 Tax=Nilaparvata lugens TaxID=108931 RepID=UPI00193DF57B|nr:unconventional myosin-Ie [Nilaparvata lugens]
MVYHWQSHNVKLSGVDDMVLLPKVSQEAIVENLRKRFMDDYIFTCIGPVLVSVNPFKQMPYFGSKEIDMYQGAAPYENPPHVYALADNMFRNLTIDNESQCVIISGESGAGKTVAAKYIMSYIATVSGGGQRVQKIKDVILESNPLLEAFGNAKTLRNNNSSRFGKYVEMQFGAGGQPEGGKVSNFLLEKSRVVLQNSGERSFHIFYQLCCGADEKTKKELGLAHMNYYSYLKGGGSHVVEGTNDSNEFKETLKAMNVMGLTKPEQTSIFQVVSAVLHIGNITFIEKGNYACIQDNASLEYPSFLLEVKTEHLKSKLQSRRFEGKWGKTDDSIEVTLTKTQAEYTRDALAKALYARLFDKLVDTVNMAMKTKQQGNNIGILDIYGFEIFQQNGFEQFCINFVNEKLQQIFIQLTLKAEQEEYIAENIRWTPIDYFNNAIVVGLMEHRSPPGIFSILDDICATKHAVTSGIDDDFHKKLNKEFTKHQHYGQTTDGFTIHHYAGSVTYNVEGFCDKNRDVLFTDLIELMQDSNNAFIRELFTDSVPNDTKTKSRPSTAGNKIRSQANMLVNRLMACTPHYIRILFIGRYAILTRETWPHWRGDEKDGVRHILKSVNLDHNNYQLGITKVFIKAPESLFLLEERRDRKFNFYAKIIQRAFKKYFARQQRERQKEEAANILFGKKMRRKYSLNRNFMCDYIGVESNPGLLSLIGPREKILFAEVVKKYDRKFKVSMRDLILTPKALYLIGREKAKKKNLWSQSEYIEVVKRKIEFDQIADVTMSSQQDDFVIIHLKADFDSLLELVFKTEFVFALAKIYAAHCKRELLVKFVDSCEFRVKKIAWSGGGVRNVKFELQLAGDEATRTPSGKTLVVSIGPGLPKASKPNVSKPSSKQRPAAGTRRPNKMPPAPNRSAPLPPGGAAGGRPGGQGRKQYAAPSRSSSKHTSPSPSRRARTPQPAYHLVAHLWQHRTRGGTEKREAPKKPPPPTKKPNVMAKPNIPRVKALYNYSAQDLDELSFKEGDIIDLIKEHDGGWWQGRLRGKEGLLPANYVEKL